MQVFQHTCSEYLLQAAFTLSKKFRGRVTIEEYVFSERVADAVNSTYRVGGRGEAQALGGN